MNVWQKTGVQNLLRNAQSGRYYARFTVAGKTKWVALKTAKKTVATLRLNDERSKQDKMRMALQNVSGGIATMGEIAEIWKQRKQSDVKLGPRTRLHKMQMASVVARTMDNFKNSPPEQLTRAKIEDWRNKLRSEGTGFVNPFSTGGRTSSSGKSASNINKLLDVVRQMLDIAIERGQLAANPMAIKGLKLKLEPKKPNLPEPNVLHAIYSGIETNNGGNSPHSADLCRLLNYTGMRISEARELRWQQVDFVRKLIDVHGTKTSAARRDVPMTKESRALLVKLYKEAQARATHKVAGAPYVDPQSKVSTVGEAAVSLRNACKRMKIDPPLTHHDLRDAFTTSCIESGVDIPTVAAWLGHKDGGALLMRVYAHHRRKHSAAQAAKVSFGGAS